MSNHRFTTTVITAALLTVPSLANKVGPAASNYTINVPSTSTDLMVYGSVRLHLTRVFNADRYFGDPLLQSRFHKDHLLYKLDGPTNTNKMNIEKSRFGFSTITPNAKLGNITTNIEFEAKGAYEDREVGLKLRQATVGFGNLIIGRTGSTFIDTDAGPETLSPAAPIGQPNFDVSNFNLIRYAAPINQHISFAVSLEDGVSKPDQVVNFLTESEGKGYTHSSKCPTMVGALTYSDSWGHVGIRVLEQKWSVYHDCSTTPGHSRSSFATQLSSAVNVGKDKLVGTVYAGKGLGAYGTGTTSESQIMVANDKSYKVILNDQVGWQLGYTHNWNDKVRSNLVSSRVNMIKSDFNPYLKNARDYVVNTIVNVAKGVEFGLEYMLQKTKINNDFEPISSYSKTNDARPDSRRLYSNRIAAVLTAKF